MGTDLLERDVNSNPDNIENDDDDEDDIALPSPEHTTTNNNQAISTTSEPSFFTPEMFQQLMIIGVFTGILLIGIILHLLLSMKDMEKRVAYLEQMLAK